jgi:SsrA-binding protein
MSDKNNKHDIKVVATNRRAHADYEILETLEAGMILSGPEVKSLRGGKANLQDGFVRLDNNRAILMNVHIAPYAMGSTHVHQEPTRSRELLLNKSEIDRWAGRVVLRGLTVVPLELYFSKRGIAKVKIGLAKGKNAPDRRQDLKKKDLQRQMRREFGGKHHV